MNIHFYSKTRGEPSAISPPLIFPLGRLCSIFIGTQLGGLWRLILKALIDQFSTSLDSQRSQWPEESGVLAARERGILGDNVLVGVLDTGIDPGHIEFTGRSITFQHIKADLAAEGRTNVEVSAHDTGIHGTHVCGVVAGKTVGIAPNARLFVTSVIDSPTVSMSMNRVALGLEWIYREFTKPENNGFAAIVLIPLGFDMRDAPAMGETEFQGRLATIKYWIDQAVMADILPIAAIGNSGKGIPQYPAAYDSVIGVGSVGFDGVLDPNSASGRASGQSRHKPDLVGYGVSVNSGICRTAAGDSHYCPMSGTSQAAAYVAGIAALYRSHDRSLCVEGVIQILRDTSLSLGDTGRHGGRGLARFVPE